MAFEPIENQYDHQHPGRPRYEETTSIYRLRQQLGHLRYWVENHPSEDARETLVERVNEMVIEITWREDKFFYEVGPLDLDLQPR